MKVCHRFQNSPPGPCFQLSDLLRSNKSFRGTWSKYQLSGSCSDDGIPFKRCYGIWRRKLRWRWLGCCRQHWGSGQRRGCRIARGWIATPTCRQVQHMKSLHLTETSKSSQWLQMIQPLQRQSDAIVSRQVTSNVATPSVDSFSFSTRSAFLSGKHVCLPWEE